MYKSTICDEGWAPRNMFCYKLVKDEPKMFAQAENYCKTIGGGLVSLHSLDSMEMISTQFHAGTPHTQRNQSQDVLGVWIGLNGTGNPAILSWVDETPVSFTYWDRNHPIQPSGDSGCVSYSGEVCVSCLWVCVCDNWQDGLAYNTSCLATYGYVITISCFDRLTIC